MLLPGGREQLARADRLAKGVMVDDGMWAEVITAGELIGVSKEERDDIVR